MKLKQLKTFWIFTFLLAISIVRSEVIPVSSFNSQINEHVQQGQSHDEHVQIIAELLSNVEDENDELRRKNLLQPATINSIDLVIRLCRYSTPLAFLFRPNSWKPSIPLRLKTSTYRI
jgi:hypothetical protein